MSFRGPSLYTHEPSLLFPTSLQADRPGFSSESIPAGLASVIVSCQLGFGRRSPFRAGGGRFFACESIQPSKVSFDGAEGRTGILGKVLENVFQNRQVSIKPTGVGGASEEATFVKLIYEELQHWLRHGDNLLSFVLIS